MTASRATEYRNIGSKDTPGLILNAKGPYFQEVQLPLPPPAIRLMNSNSATIETERGSAEMRAMRGLWCAVIQQAFEDKVSGSASNKRDLDRCQAAAWLLRQGKDFEAVCDFAGMSPSAMHEAARDINTGKRNLCIEGVNLTGYNAQAALRKAKRGAHMTRRECSAAHSTVLKQPPSKLDRIFGQYAGAPVNAHTLSKGFQEAREGSGVMWSALDQNGRKQTPPSFHELRSRAKRLYTEQGNVDTKALLGHRDDRTAAMYGDSRRAEWITVKVG